MQRGLALSVQPSGHGAWKCVYTIRGRGPRWYHLGDARGITLSDARKLASKILYQVAEGKDPHADRLALRGRARSSRWPGVTSRSAPGNATRAGGKQMPSCAGI
jgi:Arm DNA-binding domain